MRPETPVWKEIVARFGTEILGRDGRSIDRARLGKRVFARADDREFLNRLIHPLVLQERNTLIARLRAEGRYRIFVSEAALTIEAGYADHFHKVVVAHCALEHQLARLRKRDRIGKEEALRRIRSQMPADDKLVYADYVIRTGGSLAETVEQSEQVYRYLLQDYLSLATEN
jgi:dephospho-CoA kinase